MRGPVQSLAPLGKSTMPGHPRVCQIGRSEQQVHQQPCVAFGVQGTCLACVLLCLVCREWPIGKLLGSGTLHSR